MWPCTSPSLIDLLEKTTKEAEEFAEEEEEQEIDYEELLSDDEKI